MSSKKCAVMYLVFYIMTVLGTALLLINLLVRSDILEEFMIPLLLLAGLLIGIGVIGALISYFVMEHKLGCWEFATYAVLESINSFMKTYVLLLFTVGIFGIVDSIRVLANKV